MLSQNDSIDDRLQGVHARASTTSRSSGRRCSTAQPINIADLGALPRGREARRRYRHNRSFDDKTGYRARSMLTVPMLSAMGEVIGVDPADQQEARRRAARCAGGDFDGEVIPFDQRAEELALAPGGAGRDRRSRTRILYDEIRELFDGLRRRLGDRHRVARSDDLGPLAAGGDAVRRRWPRRSTASPTGRCAAVHFTRDAAAADRVRRRAARLRQGRRARAGAGQGQEALRGGPPRHPAALRATSSKALEVEHAERKLRVALELGEDDLAGARRRDRRRARAPDGRGRRGLVASSTAPTSRPCSSRAGFERLVEIARLVYLAPDGELRPYLERDEVAALQVRRGSLTDVERVEIEQPRRPHLQLPAHHPLGRSATPTCRASRPRTTST